MYVGHANRRPPEGTVHGPWTPDETRAPACCIDTQVTLGSSQCVYIACKRGCSGWDGNWSSFNVRGNAAASRPNQVSLPAMNLFHSSHAGSRPAIADFRGPLEPVSAWELLRRRRAATPADAQARLAATNRYVLGMTPNSQPVEPTRVRHAGRRSYITRFGTSNGNRAPSHSHDHFIGHSTASRDPGIAPMATPPHSSWPAFSAGPASKMIKQSGTPRHDGPRIGN